MEKGEKEKGEELRRREVRVGMQEGRRRRRTMRVMWGGARVT